MIEWADIIFAMEKRHKQRMLENFPTETKWKKMVVLDIPDDYKYMDKELIEEIQSQVDQYIEQ